MKKLFLFLGFLLITACTPVNKTEEKSPEASETKAIPLLSEVWQIRLHEKGIRELAKTDPDVIATREVLPAELQDFAVIYDLTVAYGDVTGDQMEEALIPIDSRAGNGVIGVLIYGLKINDNGTAGVELMEKIRGDRMEAKARGGKLVIAEPRFTKEDPDCCPSFKKVTTYEWGGQKFKVIETRDEKVEP